MMLNMRLFLLVVASAVLLQLFIAGTATAASTDDNSDVTESGDPTAESSDAVASSPTKGDKLSCHASLFGENSVADSNKYPVCSCPGKDDDSMNDCKDFPNLAAACDVIDGDDSNTRLLSGRCDQSNGSASYKRVKQQPRTTKRRGQLRRRGAHRKSRRSNKKL
eukprot:TRINITY_DN8190_c0_g1_i1.p1 TRINITY_DN8190_c0_g1~~TRINITY_DN8190_c0_g1_i1.p1  ORF type:complete len:164 (-),score=38.24 TRINITY_DN8190_c0_g1_i1:53-544(-)